MLLVVSILHGECEDEKSPFAINISSWDSDLELEWDVSLEESTRFLNAWRSDLKYLIFHDRFGYEVTIKSKDVSVLISHLEKIDHND